MNSFIKSVTTFILAIFTFMGIVSTPYSEPIDNYNGGDPFIAETEDGCYYTYTTGGGIDILKTNRDLLDLINQFRGVNKIKDDDSVSVIFDNFIKQSTDETDCAITVASATPPTPIFNLATKNMSRIMFITVATRRYTSVVNESPRPSIIPLRIL